MEATGNPFRRNRWAVTSMLARASSCMSSIAASIELTVDLIGV
jgi:hypothetical protein